MSKLIVAYEHDPADVRLIELAAVGRGGKPEAGDWCPAYRDTENGRPVVWIRLSDDLGSRTVWLRDADGERQVRV